jgi:hypothetical protein
VAFRFHDIWQGSLGARVLDAGHAPRVEEGIAGAFSELDRWVAEEGIFLHAEEFRIDEIA